MADIFGNPLGTPPSSGDFVRGVKQSFQELKGTGYGLLGLTGAGLGIQGLKDYGLENAQEAFNKSSAMGKPTDQLEGINSFGDAADYLQRGLGYVGGQAIPAIMTGGLGSIIGRKLVQKGIQSLTKEEIAYLSTQAAQRGAIAGAGISSYAQEAGSIYPEMVQEGHDEPGRAAAYALPAAALDVLPEMRIVKKLFPFANQGVEAAGKGIVRRVATEGGKQALAEGVTEAAQTAIERQAAYKSLNDKEAWSDYANSAALGALGGGVLGGATGAFKPGTNMLPTANPPMQGELDLGQGGGGQPNVNADMLDVGPAQEPTTPSTASQPDLFSQQFSFDPGLKPTTDQMVTPNQAADQLAQITPEQQANPSGIILPGQEPTTVQPQQPAAATPQIIVPGQPQPAEQPIVVPQNGPDIHTAYAVAMRKKERGELLTPFEVYLTKEKPGRAPVAVAQDRTVVRPSEAEEAANYAATQFGYKMTPKRLTVAKAAEEAKMQGRIDEASYDQIHTLLGQSKLGKAASVLLESTKEVTNEKQETAVPAQAVQQEAPVGQNAAVANDAAVQEVGRQDEKPGLLEKPVVEKPVVEKKKAKPKAPAFDPREKYEDNHQDGEPTYDELSKEDRAIWDDAVANGVGTIEQYDKFQQRLRRNNRVKPAVTEGGEDVPSVSGTIRKGVDILRKAPPAVLNRIKVKTATGESVPIREALSAIDKELEGYKIILKCVG